MTEQDQLALRLFYAVREVNGLMQNRLSETLEAWDLTPQQFSVLTAAQAQEVIRNSDICDLLSLSKGAEPATDQPAQQRPDEDEKAHHIKGQLIFGAADDRLQGPDGAGPQSPRTGITI